MLASVYSIISIFTFKQLKTSKYTKTDDYE